ncbi:uncharacterized protein LOC127779201 isoform X2 [Oryza glaberrima]|uniref:Uncharacterized protein n=1 Tax=Oryza glaberrima TaxID=4538 RepID=I1Q8B7_ORYGL|nr:uncharacterized protein LOC127779201 isoform X1 [Oryza glaberrima]XP_052161888.1 uncharacterized protein LOC127779201 isoform X2 [Oryza glaberrima]
MGNSCSSVDESAAAIATLAESAAAGARETVADEFARAAGSGAGGRGDVAGSAAAGVASGAGGRDDAAGDEVVIAGVLSLANGQKAAAAGAISGVESMQSYMRGTRFFCFEERVCSDQMAALKMAAACGSAAGMRAVAMVAARARHAARIAANPDVENPLHDIPEDRPDYMLSAAATGARAGVLCARMKIQAAGGDSTSHAKYVPFLAPFIGGALPGSCAAYHLVKHSPEWVMGVVFGSISLGFFAACTGTVSGLLGTSSATFQYSRFAAITTFTAVWFLFSFAMTSVFSKTWRKILCGFICGVPGVTFVRAWLYSGW